jgi:hypothetical protein
VSSVTIWRLGCRPGHCRRCSNCVVYLLILAEEQRPRGRATAWRPSLWSAAELGFPRLGPWFRERTGGKAWNASAFPQVTGLALNQSKIVREFEFMPLSCAPGRIRTCAHGSGGRCTIRR